MAGSGQAADEYFGAPPQQAMQRAAETLWPLLADNPRFVYEGRFVGLDGCRAADIDTIAALVGVQGGAAAFFVDGGEEPALLAACQARGFTTDRWDHLMADERGVAISRTVLAEYRLPDGFTLHEIDAASPPAMVADLAAMATACGVMPPAGRALRGLTRDRVVFLVTDSSGAAVACSGAVARHHPASPYADSAWWGMLATREDARGRGFSRYLGALAMTAMADRYGKRRFYTGVRKDNAISQKLCRNLGLGDHNLAVVAILDPARFGDVKLTR